MSEFKVISSSEIYKTVVKYLDSGRATTPEVVVLEKKGVGYIIKFDFHFTYDWSNGLNADKPNISIEKTNGKKVTLVDKRTIESLIEKMYM
jgi:hypothetical protein